jgi:hypothetical protein
VESLIFPRVGLNPEANLSRTACKVSLSETSAGQPEFASSIHYGIKGQPSPAKIQHRLKLAELLACPRTPTRFALHDQI